MRFLARSTASRYRSCPRFRLRLLGSRVGRVARRVAARVEAAAGDGAYWGRALIHSDHGVQFTPWVFTQRAKASGLVASMGSIGDCYDNAVSESFWGRMQVELLNRQRWCTRIELANAIFEYLEIFHNRRRRHSALEMLSPIEYERLHSTQLLARDSGITTPRKPGHIRGQTPVPAGRRRRTPLRAGAPGEDSRGSR